MMKYSRSLPFIEIANNSQLKLLIN